MIPYITWIYTTYITSYICIYSLGGADDSESQLSALGCGEKGVPRIRRIRCSKGKDMLIVLIVSDVVMVSQMYTDVRMCPLEHTGP